MCLFPFHQAGLTEDHFPGIKQVSALGHALGYGLVQLLAGSCHYLMLSCNSKGNFINRHYQMTNSYEIWRLVGEAVYKNMATRNMATIPASSIVDLLLFFHWSLMSLTAETVAICWRLSKFLIGPICMETQRLRRQGHYFLCHFVPCHKCPRISVVEHQCLRDRLVENQSKLSTNTLLNLVKDLSYSKGGLTTY